MPSKNPDTMRRLYPELDVGGFSHVDGTVDFYGRINALLREDMTVVDLGAGRGEWFYDDPSPYRRDLRMMRGKVACVVGLDVDRAVLGNESVDRAAVIEGDGILPMGDGSADLVICDAVFEHVAEPLRLAAELRRVVKAGGWVCARTPNRWGYPALAARLIPNRFHVAMLRRLQPHREEQDVFPTVFRMNTKARLDRWFPAGSWRTTVYFASGEPAYAAASPPLVLGFHTLHRVLPASLQTSLLVFMKRQKPA